MSLYGKDEINFEIPSAKLGLTKIYQALQVDKWVAITIGVVALYNLFLFVVSIQLVYILKDSPGFLLSLLMHLISLLLLVRFCFSRSNISVFPVMILCLIEAVGWISAREEMTQYYYSTNSLVLRKYDFFQYFESIQLIPYFVINVVLEDASLTAVKIYHALEELLKIGLLFTALRMKRFFLINANIIH